ncbi:MAG TPA: hypothetical protein VEZ11_11950 [Thermoanaerobaculia bacterium]|nr:hypothetical protein [Thermoanaerobaculia bacterium]
MRKLLAFVLLIALAAGAWFAARLFIHRGEVRATIIFDQSQRIGKNDPLVADGVTIGRVTAVTPMDGREAVSIRVDRLHTRDVVTDSLFAVEGDPPHTRLEVTNTFAVGRPIDDGAILYAKQDRIATWLAKHGSAVQPLLSKLKRKADEKIEAIDREGLDAQLDEWKRKVPAWKKEGSDVLDRRLDEIRGEIEKLERQLRDSKKTEEADRLKERFKRWLDEVKNGD